VDGFADELPAEVELGHGDRTSQGSGVRRG
jgi:hypothetical protein